VVTLDPGTPEIRTPEDVLRQMEGECATYPGVETGGILVGYQDPSGEATWHIRAVINAGPTATHRPASFSPDIDHANRELQRLRKADPKLTYLGGWHSHPGHLARPSAEDAEQARRILSDPDYRMPFVIVVIATTEPFRTKTYMMTREQPQFTEVTMHIDPVSAASANQETIKLEIDRMSKAGFTVRQRRSPGDVTILEMPQSDGESIVTAVLDREFPRTRPHILLQTKVSWPEEAAHLDEVLQTLLGQQTTPGFGRVAHMLPELERQGLSWRMVGASSGYAAFSLHGAGGRLAGILTIQEKTGATALYDPHQSPLALPPSLGLQDWARQVARKLSIRKRSRFERLMIVAAVVGLIIAMAWLVGGLLPGIGPQFLTIPEGLPWIRPLSRWRR
jgi:integrative and conjugative element protein (TIGR02256 family)